MDNNQRIQSHQSSKYKYLIENIIDVVWEIDKDFVFIYVSPNSKEICGYESEELIGKNLLDFLFDDSRKYLVNRVKKHLEEDAYSDNNEVVLHELRFVCKNKTIKWMQVSVNKVFYEGVFKGYIGTALDITCKKEYENRITNYIEELEKNNVELKKLASIDALTGAYSRRKFEDDINSFINNKYDIQFSLILIDIDNFKTVNDMYGHKKGDMVLQNVARLIFSNIRKTDMFFRWGGEEFIIILPETNLENAKYIADKIRNIIQDYDFGINKKITISLGVGEKIKNENSDEIIRRIDKLLYMVKKQGGNKVLY